MITDIESALAFLKSDDRFDRISQLNKNTIRLAMENSHEILLHIKSDVNYLEFKRNGKSYYEYSNSLDVLCTDLKYYMTGSKALPSAEEYRRNNLFIMGMLLCALALIGLSFLIVDYSALSCTGIRLLISTIVIVDFAVWIGIKSYLRKRDK